VSSASGENHRELGFPYAYVGLALIEGVEYDIEEAKRLIVSCPLPVVVDVISRAYRVIEKADSRVAIEPQRELLLRMCDDWFVALVKAKAHELDAHDGQPHKILFHATQLYYALKLAVVHCHDRAGVAADRSLTDLARALLIINDNIEKEHEGLAENDWFILSLFRESVLMHRGHLQHAVARWDCLLSSIPGRLANHPDYLDLRAAYREAAGVELDLFRAYAFGFFVTYDRLLPSDPGAGDMHFDYDALLKEFELGTDAKTLKALVCASADEWRQDFIDGLPISCHPYYFLRFLNRPIVEAAGEYWIPSRQFLEERLTAGVYHSVLTYIRDTVVLKMRERLEKDGSAPAEAKRAADKLTLRLLAFRGVVFEEYVCDLLGRVQSAQSSFRVLQMGASTKPGLSTCDFVILEGRRAILVECKSRFFTLQSAVSGDLSAIRGDYEKLVVKAAEQISSTIDAIESSELADRGLKPHEIDVYLPLVCTLQYVPTDYATYRFLTNAIQAKMLLGQNKTDHLQIMDVGTLELLEPYLQGGRVLSDILIKKNLDETARCAPFSNFVKNEGLESEKNEYLYDVFKRMGDFTSRFWHQRAITTGKQGQGEKDVQVGIIPEG
jgi:hypothetical protein